MAGRAKSTYSYRTEIWLTSRSEGAQPAPTLLCGELCKKLNGLISRNLAFGRNKLIQFTLAFDCNHKELIELNDVSPSNKLIVYSDNLSMQSCPSAFQLIVASVVWLPNATSARAKHFSSSKSSFTSGFNSQFIVKYIYLTDSVGAHTAISCNETTF